jgi:hypothetical protein
MFPVQQTHLVMQLAHAALISQAACPHLHNTRYMVHRCTQACVVEYDTTGVQVGSDGLWGWSLELAHLIQLALT